MIKRVCLLVMLALGSALGENAPVKARYVRVASGRATNYLHFAEVEVYAGGKNIAVKKPVKASSTMGSFTPEKAVDGVVEYTFGKDASFWSSSRDKGGEWWELDLGAEVPVEKLVGAGQTVEQGTFTAGIFRRIRKFYCQLLINPQVFSK